MNAPAASMARPSTRFRGAPARADFHADQAAPPTSSSEPPTFVISGSRAETSIAPRGGTCALSKVGFVCDRSTATTHINEITVMTMTAARPAPKQADGLEGGRHPEHGAGQRPDRLVGLAAGDVLPADDHREGGADQGCNQRDQEHRGQ